MATLLWVLGISLSISFLCSILEAVLLSVTHPHVELLRERGERAGTYLHQMLSRIDEPIAAILTLNTIAHTVGAALGGALALQVFGNEWLAAFSAVLTLVILIFSEIIPKTIGATVWRRLSRPTAYVLRWLTFVMKPILIPLSLFNRVISPTHRGPSVSRAEIEVLAGIGRREGTLDEDEWQVMTNVMNLDQVTAASVMTPRTDIVALSIDSTVDEAKDLMLDEGHLRVPVYQGGLDQIVGILLARDLWQADRSGVRQIRDIVRPIGFAPGAKPVEELLPEMQRSHTKMVIVVDDFGGTAGLVTFEDLIEEIVGEIRDEHEVDEPVPFQELEEGRFRLAGGTPLREINDRLSLALREDEHETLAGHIFGRLGRVGRIGDEIEEDGGRFRVIGMKGRRIEFVIFEPTTPAPPTDSGGQSA